MLFYSNRTKNLSRPQSPKPTTKVDPTSRDQRKQSSTAAATATAHSYKQPTGTYQNFAQNVLLTLPAREDNATVELKDVLSAVWQCQEITDVCPDLVIRLTSLRGEVRLVTRSGFACVVCFVCFVLFCFVVFILFCPVLGSDFLDQQTGLA
jgi:hypothetical protein